MTGRLRETIGHVFKTTNARQGHNPRDSFDITYSPLKTTGEIRLVTVDTNLHDGRVSCQVSPASLNAEYVAISYAWGDNTLASTILLNGKPFRVTANCEQLLRALRQQLIDPVGHNPFPRSPPRRRDSTASISGADELEPVFEADEHIPSFYEDVVRNLDRLGFWIDALCIDQHNIGERNAQVAQMDEIYSKAQGTVVYLGEHDEHSVMVLPGCKTPIPIDILERTRRSVNAQECGEIYDSHERHRECFSNRSWFHRMWVVQEVLLAKDYMFLVSGTDKFAHCRDWFDLQDLRNVWIGHDEGVYGEDSPMILKDLQELYGRGGIEYRTKGRSELPLWRLNALMDVTRGSGCSDPRDKIFAIMSLFPKPLPKLLQPDYGKTICETYTDAMWFLIDYGHTENLLAAGRTDLHSNSFPKLPGWVLDAMWFLVDYGHTENLLAAGRTVLHSASFPKLPSWVLDFSSATVAKSDGQAGFPIGQKRAVATRHGQTLIIRGVRVAMVQTGPSKTPSDGNGRDGRYEVHLDDDNSAEAPLGTKVGDCVCVFLGVEMPMLLRPLGDSSWQLVGNCYVASLMSGEAVMGVDWDTIDEPIPQAPLEDFHIR